MPVIGPAQHSSAQIENYELQLGNNSHLNKYSVVFYLSKLETTEGGTMAYFTLQLATMEQLPMLRNILTSITSAECDIILVTHHGRRIFSHKRLFSLYSKTFASWVSSVSSCRNESIAVTVDASFESVSSIIAVLSTGEATIANQEDLLDIVGLGNMIGIDMENCVIEFSKSVDEIRTGTSKKKRKRNKNRSLSLEEEFTFFNEEDAYIANVSNDIRELTIKKSYTTEEVQEDSQIQEIEFNSQETIIEYDHEQLKENVKIENLENFYQDSDDKSSDPLAKRDDSSKADLDLVINPSMKRQRAKKEKNLDCENCGERFAYELNLNKHKRIHTEEKPFKCTDCGEKFAKKTVLKFHRANKNKRFKCDECGLAFGVFSALKVHKLTHQEEKPFKCEICPKQFIQQINLIKHIRIYMSSSEEEHREMEERKLNAKRFKCDECAMMLSSKKTLRGHKRIIHSDIRPFKCNQCSKSFAHRGDLNVHNKKYHQGFRRQKTLFVLNA